ncbi:MAG: DUF386 domain-containing protein [Verrucomicrobia bacterium]|nr:MAG: DUF386 domain-containing protein [Verrucomicrobiota bacterium]
MALFGSLSAVRSQLIGAHVFDLALDYAERALRTGTREAERIAGLAEGETVRIELGEGVFALEQAYFAKPAPLGKWEAHERFIDVQVIVTGRELMRLCDVRRLTVSEDLRIDRDLLFFAPNETGSVLQAQAGDLAVFFPVDGHMPSLADGESVLVRKTVVKVPFARVKASD